MQRDVVVMKRLFVVFILLGLLCSPCMANDKALHFGAGLLIGTAVDNPDDAVLASSIVGTMKEFYDSQNGGPVRRVGFACDHGGEGLVGQYSDQEVVGMNLLEKLKSLHSAATPGPWEIHRADVGDEFACMVPSRIEGVGVTVVSEDGELCPYSEEWEGVTLRDDAGNLGDRK